MTTRPTFNKHSRSVSWL